MKDNEYLQFAVVTGILRVAKEGIFSGLNNLKTYTVLNNKYAESFGLIETEVKNAFGAKEKVYLKGLVTESRLRKLGLKNQILEVDAKSKVTSLAMDYIKENSIELYHERGQ